MLSPNQIKGQIISSGGSLIGIARSLDVSRSLVTKVIQRRRHNELVKREISKFIRLDYDFVWGKSDSVTALVQQKRARQAKRKQVDKRVKRSSQEAVS